MTGRPNKTKNAVRILKKFCDDPTAEIHGFKFVEELDLKSGAVYPLLIRWENMGWVESRWEESDRPGPRKRLYRLTAKGVPAAREFLAEARPERSGGAKQLGGFPSAAPEPA
jgi:PadR family transcriptional regulator PadR